MKKLKIISNIFWIMSLIIMELVILQQYKIINFLPTSPNFYHEITSETLYQSDYFTCLINSIGYVFLGLSIAIKFFVFMKSQNTSIKDNWIKILILLFNILLIIQTIFILYISLLITFFSLMGLNFTPI